METYIAALDQGTTTSRAILFNSRGEIVSKAQYPFRQIFPQPGWVEHDPMEIWATTVRALSEAVDAAHIDPKAIAGVGITNQRETAILWDRRTGQPVYNAIVWQCRRTAEAPGPGARAGEALRRAGHPHGPAAGAEVQQRGLRPSGFRLAGIGGSGGHPGVRQRGRSAVRPVRTGLLYSRSGEEHLRDRLLYPDERGRYAGAVPQRPCDQRGLAGGGENRLRLGGQRVQRRQHRDELGLIQSAPECDRLAESVPDSGGVVVVPAFTGLGAPYWDMYARGTIVGLTRGSTKAHIARAVLECIAYQTADLVRVMNADAPCPLTELRVDGGASVSDILMQIQADLLRLPVDRPAQVETTAFGAAALAGLAVGVWNGFDELAALRRSQCVFRPQREEEACLADLARWHRAVERSRSWIENNV